MVGPLVALDETDPARGALVIDDVDTGDLRLLAAVGSKRRDVQCLTGSTQDAGIAFVKPLRGRATLSRRRSASLQAQFEHSPGIRLRTGTRFFLMHLVALFHATSVSQAGARNE